MNGWWYCSCYTDGATSTKYDSAPNSLTKFIFQWSYDPSCIANKKMYSWYEIIYHSQFILTGWYRSVEFLRTFCKNHQLSEYGSEWYKKEDDIDDGRKQLWKQLSLICPTWSHFNITNIISFFFGDIFVRCCFPQNFFTATWVENKKKILLKIV